MIRDSKGRSTVIDLTGKRFNRLTVIKFSGMRRHQAVWECLCTCGMTFLALGSSLRGGHARSCGCLTLEGKRNNKFRTHGMSHTPEFNCWRALQSRCYNPHNNRYYRYGARGIKVCARWRGKDGFANFFIDMGRKPTPKHSIDRFPNNDGDYEPGNCRWATNVQQWDNRRKKGGECQSSIRMESL